MADVDPLATQRDLIADIPAELVQAGFDDVEAIGRCGRLFSRVGEAVSG